MISVSDAWKEMQRRFLLPESYLEIDFGITDDGAQSAATASGTDEEVFSNAEGILGTSNMAKYATNELNLWALDGSRSISPDSGTYENAGYVSNIESTGSVTLKFEDGVRTTAIPGITITWSDKYNEYPKTFTVTGKNGEEIVAEVTVTNNTNRVSTVFISLQNYDSIVISVHDWNLPHRRVRIEKVVVGHMLTLTKSDILSFEHKQSGEILSGELPKYSIEFALDNSDGRWNLNNPTGMERYLSERQKLTLRYGLDVNGSIEWIKGGTFYLSEWYAPPNGFEARFVARDVFEFLIATNTTKLPNMSSTQYGPLSEVVGWATRGKLPTGASVVMDPSLSKTAGREFGADGTYAEMVQKCANAACCILRYNRDGTLYVEPLDKTLKEYIYPEIGIPLSLSYSYPEITLSKPLKEVVVDYGDTEPYSVNVADNGEIQTVTNDYIYTEEAATTVASWVADVLKNRKTVSGEFRADPRLDLYDIITVEDKYGQLMNVVITDVTYTFNGSFRGTYKGRVLEDLV